MSPPKNTAAAKARTVDVLSLVLPPGHPATALMIVNSKAQAARPSRRPDTRRLAYREPCIASCCSIPRKIAA